MIDIFMLSAIAIAGSLILMCMGLSYLSQSLNALEYSGAPYEALNYNQNPLIGLKSKYFHYRPKNSVLLTEKKWAAVEKGIAKKIGQAEEVAKAGGYARALEDIENRIAEENTHFPTNPYKILDVAAKASVEEVRIALNLKLSLYALRNFSNLDDSFKELAEIRLRQAKEAYDKIKDGYSEQG